MKIPAWDVERQLYSNSSTANEQTKCSSSSSALPVPVERDHHDASPVATARSQTASVMFSDEDNVIHDILPLSAYSVEEIESCWFSRYEYNAFKRNSLVTLSLNRTGALSPDDPEHTMRGLECRTRECTDSRRMLRYQATAAVFEEQARQRQGHHYQGVDPQAISDCYHAISWHSMYDAHVQGLADEQDCLEAAVDSIICTATSVLEEPDIFAALSSPSSKRNSVLGSIISIDHDQEEEPFAIAGFNSDLWTSCASSSEAPPAFNLNSFFSDMPVAVAAA
ncbi:expressed unknown protein [Seminavis robusta]|uniref:Uncharacterized protein n=1 Tax=Seminavis robusta TaxID=568900 RepID=A0A9N8HH19_9STRA|nr:expressed unknown protein [Seminavis robusta]|eukprot:Sro609_g174950.1 n/a (280) ;mRNA; r:11129-11968